MKEEKWWAGEDRAPTLRPLLVRGQGNEICRKPKGIRKFRETLSHGCTANMICASLRSGAADWRSGSRWSILSVLCPVHPFPLRGISPQGETRNLRRKTESHMLHVPFRRFPLWWLAPPPCPVGSMSLDSRVAYSSPMNPVPLPPPASGGTIKLREAIFFIKWFYAKHGLFCSRLRGKSGTAG